MNKEQFDCFVDKLLDSAVKEFKSTKQYELLKEKLDQMERDCETMLTEEEHEFAKECFELLMDAKAREKQYVYRQGLLDCAAILKGLGVLA